MAAADVVDLVVTVVVAVASPPEVDAVDSAVAAAVVTVAAVVVPLVAAEPQEAVVRPEEVPVEERVEEPRSLLSRKSNQLKSAQDSY